MLHMAALAVILLTLMGSMTSRANAALKLCNDSGSAVGVAVGYKNQKGWISEGWWKVNSDKCVTLIKDDLIARYYYIHAIDLEKGGFWGGTAMLCTEAKEFTIIGFNDCESRGYVKKGFYEVDTGERQEQTVRLTEDSKTPNN
jgi:uncharacterized membrane protein